MDKAGHPSGIDDLMPGDLVAAMWQFHGRDEYIYIDREGRMPESVVVCLGRVKGYATKLCFFHHVRGLCYRFVSGADFTRISVVSRAKHAAAKF